MKKDIITLLDLEREDFEFLLNRAKELKKEYKRGGLQNPLAGKTIGLLFEKPSTRTRVSFETAVAHLGGTAIFLSAQDLQISRNEPVKDTARVLSRYLDGLVIRTFSQKLIEEFAEVSSISVINALTDLYHPCQILSDLQTVVQYKGGFEGVKIAWVGDGNNVAHSWINAASVLGFHLSLACPKGYTPNEAILSKARSAGNKKIEVTDDPKRAVADADVIYTDVWASMGQESEQEARKDIFAPFCVNEALVGHAKANVIVMHCLPAHRGEEITDAVLEGAESVVWDQSENKLHMHKAILETLIGH